MPEPALIPVRISREDTGIRIEWDRSGHETLLGARDLRLACPCAGCKEEMTGRPLLDPDTVPADLRPLAVALVGAYGIRVTWSDGHATGIYTYVVLRSMCGCPRCQALVVPGVDSSE